MNQAPTKYSGITGKQKYYPDKGAKTYLILSFQDIKISFLLIFFNESEINNLIFSIEKSLEGLSCLQPPFNGDAPDFFLGNICLPEHRVKINGDFNQQEFMV